MLSVHPDRHDSQKKWTTPDKDAAEHVNERTTTPKETCQETLEAGDFTELLNKQIRPKSESAKEEVSRAVQTLAEQAIAASVTVAADVTQTIKEIIAEIDKKLSDQVNQILHHPDFQQMEAAWRGLHYLVNNTEVDESP